MIFVVDANVFIKLFVKESDSVQAHKFFRAAVENNAMLLAPTLFRYEVWEAARVNGIPLDIALNLLAAQEGYCLHIIEPSRRHVLKAETIANKGHQKSGFPSMYDSIFHALAIESDGVFITADHKHYAKAKTFGHIALLSAWRKLPPFASSAQS